MNDVEIKFAKVAKYWVDYCVDVKGADLESESDMAAVYQHLCDNYAKIEEAYDLAMLQVVATSVNKL